MGSIPSWGNPLEKKTAIHPVFLFVKPHGQKSLVGYNPQGCKGVEQDLATKQTRTHTGESLQGAPCRPRPPIPRTLALAYPQH